MCEYQQNTDIKNIICRYMYIRIRITGNITLQKKIMSAII